MESAAQGQSIIEQLSSLVEGNEIELPPYPDVLMRLRQVLESEDSCAQDVAELIANEPAVAAHVLRIANSAAYGGLHPVSEIGQAVARLGMQQVGSMVTALTVKEQFKTQDSERRKFMQSLWDHAIATALAARFMAQRMSIDCEQAFLAGLLHDTGKLLVVRGVEILRERGADIPTSGNIMTELMAELHPKLGCHALSAWNLPEEMARIALGHHDPEPDSNDVLMLCVQAANLVSRKAGFHPEPDPELPLLHEPAVEMLGLRDLSIATMMIELEDEIETKHQLFGAG